jgi:hypothetical protein
LCLKGKGGENIYALNISGKISNKPITSVASSEAKQVAKGQE